MKKIIGIILLGMLFSIGLSAFSYKIIPVNIELSVKQNIKILKLKNLGASDSMFRVSIMKWTEDENGSMIMTKLNKKDKFIVTPKIFKIKARETKSIRIAKIFRNKNPKIQNFYRIIVSEIKSNKEVEKTGLTYLVKINIPLIVNEQLKVKQEIEVVSINKLGKDLNIVVKSKYDRLIILDKIIFYGKDGKELKTLKKIIKILPNNNIKINLKDIKDIDKINKIRMEHDKDGKKDISL